MKILNINTFRINNTNLLVNNLSHPRFISGMGDIVSFSAKKYDEESILNPTNHCAYCGSKVYSEQQLESIAKEILSSKYDRIHGKIKSILEKLESAKHSDELTIAKRIENEEEIKFFKNLLDIASKKSFLKGDAIFEQVFHLSHVEAQNLLMQNLLPLKKTIDHVSPQNLEQDNNNSDINLVEACQCCNGRIKKGLPFDQFDAMYPSIQFNMPSEKYRYAKSKLLDIQGNSLLQRLSATNLLKTIQRLFIQRNEAQTYLDSIDFRIKNSTAAIQTAILASQDELSSKQDELEKKENQFKELQNDPEFNAILKRISLNKSIETQEGILSQLRAKAQHISNQINELRNPQHKKKPIKPQKDQKSEKLTPEQKQRKIEDLKSSLSDIQNQISEHVSIKQNLENDITNLDKQFPPIIILQRDKNSADAIVTAHNQLTKINQELEEKQTEFDKLTQRQSELAEQLALFPSEYKKKESFPENVRIEFERFLELTEALNFIIEHPNGGNVNALIKQSAKTSIEKEIESLKQNPLVIQHYTQHQQASVQAEKSAVDKNITNIKNAISSLNNNKAKFEKTAAELSKEDAMAKSEKLADAIRTKTEKEQLAKLPQIIETIRSEILLITSTIADLQTKLYEISPNNTQNLS